MRRTMKIYPGSFLAGVRNVRPWASVATLLIMTLSHLSTSANAFLSLTDPSRRNRMQSISPWNEKGQSFRFLQAKLTSEEVRDRLDKTIARLREKDRKTKLVDPSDLIIAYEDDHLVVVDKPAGILSVPSEPGIPSLVESVFLRYQQQVQAAAASSSTSSLSSSANITTTNTMTAATAEEPLTKMSQMVVHRLGMETSGLIVFAKSMEAVRGLNTLFRTRKITRQYQALVCGHIVAKKHGLINLPLMRDYEHPPFMRISTEEHQGNLLELDATIVGRKLLRAPMQSLTHFQVLEREYYKNNTNLPVTRIILTSISGRTHQLNVHCAAYGHAIVHDLVYGHQGEAAPNGGLSALEDTLSHDRASLELQQQLREASQGDRMCIHSTLIRFKHPVTKETIELTSRAPF